MSDKTTDVLLDVARQAAKNGLLDRAAITMKLKAYNALVAMLDAPRIRAHVSAGRS